MGFYKESKKAFATEYKERSQTYRDRLAAWGKESAVSMAIRPTNLARARELGYKAKQGVHIARVSIRKGRRMRPAVGGGRKPSKSGRFFSRTKSLQTIAEERAAVRFANMEVLNSYFVGETGERRFYEVILLDRASQVVMADPFYSSVVSRRCRAQRGLTRSGRKSRGPPR
ncbi:50S ribosomal protein L15e [Candidatus Marsarchaeota archaeon]|jgi:large subunit ribosomal protein L15e|nr:50S ribosomal protein L15e [Candidatus Marsarchaeota archaeon]MCL5100006.1 50S ribosomal protein L15e [Candidatus Marsarchaeota archaeon]